MIHTCLQYLLYLGKAFFKCISDHFSRLQLKHGSIFHEFHEGAFLGMDVIIFEHLQPIVIRPQNSPLSLGLALDCLEDDEALLLYALIRAVRHDPGHGISKM